MNAVTGLHMFLAPKGRIGKVCTVSFLISCFDINCLIPNVSQVATFHCPTALSTMPLVSDRCGVPVSCVHPRSLHDKKILRIVQLVVNDVTDLLPHAGLDRGTWDVISTPLGGVPNVVVFAFMPKETLDVAVAAARITPTGASEACALTPVEVVQLGLIWRWSRQKVGSGEGALQSHEPGSSGAEAVVSPHAPAFNARYAKKVKLSTVLDQVPELTPDAYDRLVKKQQELVGELELHEAEPTEDQFAALQLRVIGRGGTPNADFAVPEASSCITSQGMASAARRKLQGGHRPRPSGLHRLSSLLACLQNGASVPEGPSWRDEYASGQRACGRQSQCFGRVLRGIL